MRACIEAECMYAAEYPFIDYGSDLAIMSQLEAGVKITKLEDRWPEDTQLTVKEKDRVEKYLAEKQKAIRWTKVPQEFYGRGQGGWYLYDWVHHRRSGAAKPSETFKNLVKW